MYGWLDERMGYTYTQTEKKNVKDRGGRDKTGKQIEYRKNTENGNTERIALHMRWDMENTINHSKDIHDIYSCFINTGQS